LVSPTRFTNSVHNAAAGYWHIAAGSRAPSTSLAAFDASFAAGLLEAVLQVCSGDAPVLLVACDVPYPEPLHAVRPVLDTFAVALLLAPAGECQSAHPVLHLRHTEAVSASPVTPCDHAGLEAVRMGIPAARALPLLQAIAHGDAAQVVLDSLPGAVLVVDVEPAR
jgi:hypothetical protein